MSLSSITLIADDIFSFQLNNDSAFSVTVTDVVISGIPLAIDPLLPKVVPASSSQIFTCDATGNDVRGLDFTVVITECSNPIGTVPLS